MIRFLVLVAAAVIKGMAAEPTVTADLERLRTAHEQSVAAARAQLGKQVAPARQAYLARLRELLKQLSPQGNDVATAAVLEEITRMEKGEEPPPEVRRKMTGLLLATRVLYEKACGLALPAALKVEEAAKARWLQGLTDLEARYGRTLDFNKIAAVKAERERITQPPAPPPPPPQPAAPPSATPGDAKQMKPLVLSPVDDTFVDQMPFLAGGRQGSPIRLEKKDVLTTLRTFKPPVDIAIEAMTDSTNLRMGYAADQIIFNWELNMKQLRVDGGPAARKHKSNAGQIPTKEFVNLRWIVTPKRQAIYVDGELRFEHIGDYSAIDKPVRVFPREGSEVVVRSLKVKQLPPGTE